MNIFKKKEDFVIEISNVIYLLDKLKHDKGNFNLRLELACNLENLNNSSDALFHLIIAYEIDPNNQVVIEKIVQNLININNFYEAKKWSLKLEKNSDLIRSVKSLEDQHDINKLIFFGLNFPTYPYCLNINLKLNFDDFFLLNKKKIEDSIIIYVEKNSLSTFKKFYESFRNNLNNINYIFTETDDIRDLVKHDFSQSSYSEKVVNKMISSFIKHLNNENLKLYLRI